MDLFSFNCLKWHQRLLLNEVPAILESVPDVLQEVPEFFKEVPEVLVVVVVVVGVCSRSFTDICGILLSTDS